MWQTWKAKPLGWVMAGWTQRRDTPSTHKGGATIIGTEKGAKAFSFVDSTELPHELLRRTLKMQHRTAGAMVLDEAGR